MDSPDRKPAPVDSLRAEIVEAQKQGAEMQRWKIVASAAIVAAVLGLGGEASKHPISPYILCAIPPLCLFADMLCAQIGIRIAVIAGYLRSQHDAYELYVAETASHGPFRIEPFGAIVTTTVLCLFVGLYPWLAGRIGQPDGTKLAADYARALQWTAGITWPLTVVVFCFPMIVLRRLEQKSGPVTLTQNGFVFVKRQIARLLQRRGRHESAGSA